MKARRKRFALFDTSEVSRYVIYVDLQKPCFYPCSRPKVNKLMNLNIEGLIFLKYSMDTYKSTSSRIYYKY